jgi:hypothetical protein
VGQGPDAGRQQEQQHREGRQRRPGFEGGVAEADLQREHHQEGGHPERGVDRAGDGVRSGELPRAEQGERQHRRSTPPLHEEEGDSQHPAGDQGDRCGRSNHARCRTGNLSVLGSGDAFTVEADEDQDTRTGGMEVLFLGGRSLREPVAWAGPFVMNSVAAVRQPFDDFHAGVLGEVPRDHPLAPTNEVVAETDSSLD